MVDMPTTEPGKAQDGHETHQGSSDASAVSKVNGTITPHGSFVELANGPAIMHDDSTTGPAGGFTVVQLVTRIPPHHRGAIVTALSSEAGCGVLLNQVITGLAESLRTEPLPEMT